MEFKMKKIVLFLTFVLIFLVSSCGEKSNNGKKRGELYGDCYPNKTCNEGFVCDTEYNVCIKDRTDHQYSDSDTTSNDDDIEMQVSDEENNSSDDDTDSTDLKPDEDVDSTDSHHDDTDPADSLPDDDSDTENTTRCTLDNSILQTSADSYFAFRGEGKINLPTEKYPFFASSVNTGLVGIEGKDIDLAKEYSIFIEAFLPGNDDEGSQAAMPAVGLNSLGDPNISTGYFTTVVAAFIPVSDIDALRASGEYVFPSAPLVQVLDIATSSDGAYSKQCVVASNKYTHDADTGKEVPAGKWQVCYNDNVSFEAGETFRLAMVAELETEQQQIVKVVSAGIIEDPCACFDNNTNAEVDCTTIADFYNPPPDPCDPNPCDGVIHSTNECIAADEMTYSCECKSGYYWNGSICRSSSTTLPECDGSTLSFPCFDSASGLTWSEKTTDAMAWNDADDYCNGLNTSNYGGFSNGWHLPTIGELRTLIQNCENTVLGGICSVTDDCLESSCQSTRCYFCANDANGKYSKFRDTDSMWSSSNVSDIADTAWYINFYGGKIYRNEKTQEHNVRCVR